MRGGTAIGATAIGVAMLWLPASAVGVQTGADVQALIDAALPGSTVTVPSGVHEGPVVIDETLTLRGEPGAVLDGMGEGSVVTIGAPDVEISGLSIVNGGRLQVGAPSGVLVKRSGARAYVHDLDISNCYLGVTVQRARNVLVERIRVTGEGIISGEMHVAGEDGVAPQDAKLRGDGIWLFDTPGAVVRDNVLTTVRDGIYLSYGSDQLLEGNMIENSRYAIHDMYAAGTVIRNNVLRGNLSGLVLMYGGPVLAEGNTITESGSPSTGFGVLVKDVGSVTLRENVIADNRVGVNLDDAGRTGGDPAFLDRNTIAMNQVGALLVPSADSSFTGNGFLENTTQVALGGTGTAQAQWMVDGIGNYWSDYGGFDSEGDGQGDLAYTRSGRVSRLIAEDPMLLAVASGPAFRLLSAVEDKWAPADPLVMDVAPRTVNVSPPIAAGRTGTVVPLWIPGSLLTAGCAWLLVAARRRKVASHG
jgi:nitrous oxidase accessory protein